MLFVIIQGVLFEIVSYFLFLIKYIVYPNLTKICTSNVNIEFNTLEQWLACSIAEKYYSLVLVCMNWENYHFCHPFQNMELDFSSFLFFFRAYYWTVTTCRTRTIYMINFLFVAKIISSECI